MVNQAHQVLGVDDLIGQEHKLALFLHELAVRLCCLFTPSEVPGEVTLGVRDESLGSLNRLVESIIFPHELVERPDGSAVGRNHLMYF